MANSIDAVLAQYEKNSTPSSSQKQTFHKKTE